MLVPSLTAPSSNSPIGDDCQHALADELNEGLKETVFIKADLTVAKADLMTAISKAKNEALVWQVRTAFALFGVLKIMKSNTTGKAGGLVL